jgi:hypothetical protein
MMQKGYAAYEKAMKEVTGNPTGQGFGAARKGPAVQGPEAGCRCRTMNPVKK